MIKRKIGIVEFTNELLLSLGEEDLREIFSNFFPVNIVHQCYNIVSYTGLSPFFREIESGEKIPTYDLVFERDEIGLCKIKDVHEVKG